MSDKYKISDPAEMAIHDQPPLAVHPGLYVRDVILPQFGLKKIAPVAALLKVNRPNLHQVLNGEREVSRELAYRLGALLGDAVADLVIAYQHRWNLEQEQGHREALKREIAPLGQPAAA